MFVNSEWDEIPAHRASQITEAVCFLSRCCLRWTFSSVPTGSRLKTSMLNPLLINKDVKHPEGFPPLLPENIICSDPDGREFI